MMNEICQQLSDYFSGLAISPVSLSGSISESPDLSLRCHLGQPPKIRSKERPLMARCNAAKLVRCRDRPCGQRLARRLRRASRRIAAARISRRHCRVAGLSKARVSQSPRATIIGRGVAALGVYPQRCIVRGNCRAAEQIAAVRCSIELPRRPSRPLGKWFATVRAEHKNAKQSAAFE